MFIELGHSVMIHAQGCNAPVRHRTQTQRGKDDVTFLVIGMVAMMVTMIMVMIVVMLMMTVMMTVMLMMVVTMARVTVIMRI